MNKLKDIKIGRKQYLADVIRQIQNNTILFKFLCGIGATTLEIETESRSSIIIVPNRPVIDGKCKKYNEKRKKDVILGVFEGVSVNDVTDYLESDVAPKKLLTTPESFMKIVDAMTELEMLEAMYNEYFIMFDECERTIQDVDYRKDIVKPMNDFFKFKNKAFISATPIMPSDPRFKSAGFQIQNVIPTFNNKQDLDLKITNNVFYTIKEHIENNPAQQYFVFLNSTNAIAYLIDFLQIKDDSAVFCSKESKNKLVANKYKNVHTSLKPFKRFNFFTSRFFSAVDIDDVINPHILIVSDLIAAEHSMVDPFSEAIQMVGRFRKPKLNPSKNRITHVTNINPEMKVLSEADVLQQIKDFESFHRTLRKYKRASHLPVVRTAIDEMMQRADFAKFINPDGAKNYYMQDNAIYDEKVKSFYKSSNDLTQAYENSKHCTNPLLVGQIC